MITTTRESFRKYTDAETFSKLKDYDTLAEMWRRCVSEYGGRVAVEDAGKQYTYAQLEADAAAFRAVLAASGAAAGQRIGILAPNSYDFIKAFIAVTTSGACAVILPAQLDTMTVFGCTMKFGLQKLIYHPSLAERTAIAAEKRPDIALIPTDAASDAALPIADCEAKTPCVVMFTGGTTGKSKGALLSNEAVMQGAVNSCYGITEAFGQRYLLVLPLSHVFGLIRNLVASLYTGSTLFICQNNKDMFRDAAAFRPTIMVMVPALAEMCLTLSKKFGRNMLGPDMKRIICGAAAVPPYLIKEYAAMGITLNPGYGLTESANLVSGNPETASKPDSVGLPFPNQELRIENGELWLRGKNMMDGYIGEDEEGVYAEDHWFRTGDLVRVDEDGFLYITGRIKEVIVLSNGENVSPAEVETHFNALTCIQDSQVFEDVTETGAHILALEVVPRATELGAVEGDRNAYILSELEKVNLSLPSFQRVSRMTIRDTDFERTPAMKIVRYKKCN